MTRRKEFNTPKLGGNDGEKKTGQANIARVNVDAIPAEIDEVFADKKDPELSVAINKIKESGKHVFVVFRSNDIYESLGADMVTQLKENNIPLTVKIFPKGTEDSNIDTAMKERMKKNEKLLEDSIYISDYTCRPGNPLRAVVNGPSIKSDMDKSSTTMVGRYYRIMAFKEEYQRLFNKTYTDETVAQYTKRKENDSSRDRDKDPEYKYLNEIRMGGLDISKISDFLPELFTKAFAIEEPKEIVIVLDKITEHMNGLSLGLSGDDAQDEKRVAEALSQVITQKTGFKGGIVIKYSNEIQDAEKSRVIKDRHLDGGIDNFKNARVIELPSNNILKSMKKYGLIQDKIKDEDIVRHIMTEIEASLNK